MKEIKRYEMEKEYSLDINVIPVEEHDGSFVRYDDHAAIVAALQEQVRALAAENIEMKKSCKNAAFDADYEAELGMERGGFTDALNGIKTPATDAALREIRAQVLDDMADDCEADWLDTYIDELRSSAARIRAGEQP